MIAFKCDRCGRLGLPDKCLWIEVKNLNPVLALETQHFCSHECCFRHNVRAISFRAVEDEYKLLKTDRELLALARS